MIKRLLLAISALPLLASCGVVTERGVYEGIRANQKAQSPVGAEGATMKQLPDTISIRNSAKVLRTDDFLVFSHSQTGQSFRRGCRMIRV